MEITSIGAGNSSYFRTYTGGEVPPSRSALGVIEDGFAAGAAVFSVSNRVLFVERLFIDEKYRRRGGGTLLFHAAKDCAAGLGVRSIITYYNGSPEVTSFLDRLGFACLPADPVYALSVKELLDTPNFKRVAGMKDDPKVFSLKGMPKREMAALSDFLFQNGFSREILSDGGYEPGLSFVEFDEEDKPEGIVTTKREGNDVVVTAISTKNENPASFRKLLAALAHGLPDHSGAESRLVFIGKNEKLADTLQKMIGVSMEKTGQVWSAVYQEREE